MKTALIALIALGSVSAFAVAPQVPTIDPMTHSPRHEKSNGANPVFEGIVKFSNCSGSLVTFKGTPASKKALVMTNGHCLSGLKVGQVQVNKPASGKVAVFDDKMNKHPLELKKIVYATMVDTDVTFYETNMTYEEIEAQYKVEPLVLNDEIVAIGTPISVVSGYWEILTSCEAEFIVPVLVEDAWRWKNSVRYSAKCMTKGGYSGSPVIADNTRTVVAIHNTGNNGKLDCSDMNPCEQNENGELIFRELNRRYAQQVHQFYGCLDEKFDFDLTLSTCAVAKP